MPLIKEMKEEVTKLREENETQRKRIIILESKIRKIYRSGENTIRNK